MPEKIEPQLDEIRRRARRRLVGAVVLALAAAVLVPMLLESEPKPLGEDVSVRIPPVDEGKFVSKLGEKSRSADAPPTPIKPGPAPKSAESSSTAAKDGATPPKTASADAAPAAPKPTIVPPLSSPPPKESAPATDAATPPAPSAPATPPTPPTPPTPSTPSTTSTPSAPSTPSTPSTPVKPAAPASGAPPAPASEASKAVKPGPGAYSVQLAAFSDDKGANALVNRLKKAGHPAYTELFSSPRGTVWRVRVGPFGTREAAEGARSRLKADGQDGIIATSN